jgi:hypothetical protein
VLQELKALRARVAELEAGLARTRREHVDATPYSSVSHLPQQYAQNLKTVTFPAPTRGIIQSRTSLHASRRRRRSR